MILGIETATSICSVGIADGDQIIAESRFNIKNIHAEILAESIHQLLKLSGISLAQITAFAVSIGPGSFTGLRIGLATAKGLAFASGKPLVAVSTLQALAASHQYPVISEQHSVVPAIKAREGEVYAARFQNVWPVPLLQSDEMLLTAAHFRQWLQPPAVLCGNGVAMLQQKGILGNLSGMVVVPEAAAMLSGGVIARLAETKLARGEIADLPNLEPRYLQEFEIGPKKTL